MNYNNKGYYSLNESKKAKDVQVIFLSSRAEKTSKSSNSMFFFEEGAKKAGIKMITIDPSSSTIKKSDGDNYKVIEDGTEKKTIILNPNNTIIVPRRTVLKNGESKDFMQSLQDYGFFCFNTLDTIETCEDKFLTGKKLKENGVPTPRTVMITASSINKLNDKVDEIGGQFPVVCKLKNGTQGIGVFLIDSMVSLKSTLQAIFAIVPKGDILMQEKINSDYDLRIHVMYKGFERITPGLDNYEIIGCMKRNQLAGDFRSNYSLGSTAEKGYLTPDQEKIAKMAAKAVNGRWVGVDLIMDSRTKQSYVIEVNSSPGTKGISTAAGEDVVGTLMNMFKDFKYTKYDSEQIGQYETITMKNLGDGVDAVMKFDTNKTFTEMECSSVNTNDDTTTFVFNGITYTMDLAGMRKDSPMVEMNIRFNGTVYKNELVVLKQVNDNINKNITVGGTKFMNRISDKLEVAESSFILTDNTTDFEVPVKIEESVMLNESKGDDVVGGIKMNSLKKLITRYAQGGRDTYSDGKWTIESAEKGAEGRDNWTLNYRGKVVVECKENYSTFKTNNISRDLAYKIAGVIESQYGHEVDMSIFDND